MPYLVRTRPNNLIELMKSTTDKDNDYIYDVLS